MSSGPGSQTTFTPTAAAEIRGLLEAMHDARRAVRRMNTARLGHIGVPPFARTSRSQFDALVESGTLSIAQADSAARARVTPRAAGRVFRVAVGVTRWPVDDDWSAFDQRYQWLGRNPQSVASGDHLFVLAVDRWRSAVVGLYETVSAGADRLPDSPDPDRWPWALGVRPLAAIAPPQAERVDGQRGPQSGLPERVDDEEAIRQLYAAVADSPPPPGPETLEQCVQELELEDVTEDVFEAVRDLGRQAYHEAVIERAIEVGEWSEDELAARAWYTGTGETSHIRSIVAKALSYEHSMTQRLERQYGSSPYTFARPGQFKLGATYRGAGDREPIGDDERAATIDIAELERATRRHMQLQDRLADELLQRGVEPRSPAPSEPQFDLAFEHGDVIYVVEAKTGKPATSPQVRIGVGQVLEYCELLGGICAGDVRPVLLLETEPPHPWCQLSERLQIEIVRADDLDRSLTKLLETG